MGYSLSKYFRLQADKSDDRQTLSITALSVADVAWILAATYRRRISEDRVREVAEATGLIRPPDGTINLLEYNHVGDGHAAF